MVSTTRRSGAGGRSSSSPNAPPTARPEPDLGDLDLAKVISLLQSVQGDAILRELQADDQPVDSGQPTQARANPDTQTVSLFLAEEQEILRHAYLSFFEKQPDVRLLGSSSQVDGDGLLEALASQKPQVMLIGVKTLQTSTVDQLARLRESNPDVALVLLFAFYDIRGIKALREFSRSASTGCAYLLKHTIDSVEQLTQVVHSVAQGRMIVDPMVMEGLMKTGDTGTSLFKSLSPKAMEVMRWVAKGYRNDTIADVLSRDVKTIERHINNIYGALQDDQDPSKHPRVQGVLQYLSATGALSTEQLLDA